MGCFDVSCGLSGLSIKSGDEAKLLLIYPSNGTSVKNYVDTVRSEVKLEPTTNIIGQVDELYKPFCLPISGEYNDYGNLENIVEDETTKSLEEYFGISIEEILTIVTSNRGIWDGYSGVLSAYGDGLKVGYSDKTTEKWLIDAGFVKNGDKYLHPEINFVTEWDGNKWITTENPIAYVEFKVMENVSPKKTEKEFVVRYWNRQRHSYDETWGSEQKRLCESIFAHSKVYNFFSEKTGILLGIKKEYWDKVILLKKLSGMFIHGKLYDELFKNSDRLECSKLSESYFDENIMRYLGFNLDYYLDNNSKIVKDDGLPFNLNKIKTGVFSYKGIDNYRFCLNSTHWLGNVEIYSFNDEKLSKIKSKYDGDYQFFSPKELLKKISELGYNIDVNILNNYPIYQNYFDNIKDYYERKDNLLEYFEKSLEDSKNEDERKKALKIEMMYSMRDDNDVDNIFDSLNNFLLLDVFYKQGFIDQTEGFMKSVSQFKIFYNWMYISNRLIMPSAHFHQHGEYKEQYNLLNIISSVAEERFKEYEEEYGE